MPVLNSEIVTSLEKLADLLELEGANPFRVRAYRNAARVVEQLPTSVAAMVISGEKLSELPGIGEDLAGKIATLAQTGHLPALEEAERHAPRGAVELLSLPGLGPKRVRALEEKLGITNLDALAAAAKAGRISELAGFGKKTEENILQSLAKLLVTKDARTRLAVAEEAAEAIRRELQSVPGVRQVEVAGSYRRRKETVGDLDFVVSAAQAEPVVERFAASPDAARVLSRGPTRSSIVLRNGMQVDLRVVPEASFGSALQYFTGSKAHNIALRQIAMKRTLKLNEYGLFRGKERIAGRSEAPIYKALGLAYIEPELREGTGEIEAAAAGTLPTLVNLDDIRGDLHVHSTASDGRASIEEMARAAQALGYAYIAITDHSRHLTVAHGLDAKRLLRQSEEIARLNERLERFSVLTGVEVDVLEDGRLDLPDTALGRLEVVTAAIHFKFDLSRERQTERLIRAMDNPAVKIVGHPSGRLIGKRPAYDIDFERLARAAKERGCALELNGQPDRLDITDYQARLARDLGLRISLATDAHSTAELGFMRHAVDQARRGWIEAKHTLNALTLDRLRRAFRR